MQPIQEADQEFAGNVKTRQNVARQSAKNTRVTPDDIQSLEPIDEGFSPAPITKSSGFKPTANAPLSGLSREDIQALEPIDGGMTLSPASKPVQQEDSGGIGGFLADEAKGLAGSAISATGSAVRQAGKIYEAGAPFRASALGESEATTGNPLDSAADWLQDQGEEISGSTSILRQIAKMNSTPDGDITDPSTWTFGDDPSIRGYVAQGTDVLGSMMPIVVTGIVGRIAKLGSAALSASTATSGGLVGGGAAIEEARRTIDQMDDETLEQESKVYRDLLANGKSPEEARKEVRTQAENWASAITLPVSTLGGGLFGRAISPAGRVLGSRGVAAQTTGGALATGTIEGSQELGEGVATATGINRGAGTSLDPLEGSFGNALLGALGGSAPGTVQGFSQGISTRNLPVAKTLEPSDITQNGRPFITLGAAQRAAIEAGDNAQIYRLGNKFVVRKNRDAGSEFMDSVDRESTGSEALDQAQGVSEEGQSQQSSESVSQEFERGQRVFINQNGRSMPVEFMGYERNAATANAGPERIARIRTPDGRGYFVRVGDLVAQQPAAEGAPALPAGQRTAALPNESSVEADGDGFVMRPGQNFEMPENAPRGVRNNNPGNIEKGVGFQGEIDGNDSRFATFDSPESGIRALAVNLLTYQEKHGLNNIRGIINRWAPSSENNTDAYVQAVADAVGVSPDEQINLRDRDTMQRLTQAIIQHENGMQPYDASHIQAGVESALSGTPIAVRSTTTGQTQSQPQSDQGSTQSEGQGLPPVANPFEGVTPGVLIATGTNADSVDRAAHEAQTSPDNDLPEPTQAQIEAGNYKKGHINVDGLDVSIENPQGSTRSGVDPDGNSWSRTLASHYGYIRRTNSADGEQLDAFVKPGIDPSSVAKAYVVDQVDPKTGKFDEAKVMLGYGSQQEAQAAYLENYEPDWKGMGAITEMDMAQLKNWIQHGDTRQPAANFTLPQINQQAQQPVDSALGSIASNLPNPSNNKPFVTRSKAQAYADEIGGHVIQDGKSFRVRNEIPGMDVHAPGAGRESDPESTVYTPNGRPVDVRYRVVEADSLQTSHTDAGQRNPQYPSQLQPRDRSRGASDLQINEIANNLQPDLVGVSANTSDGAPIISNRGVVESGNGRAMGIKRAYSQDTEGAKRYRKWLKDQGYDVDNMRAPVLVRQRDTEMSASDLQAYTRESNERTTLQMSPTEQAQSDGKQIAPILGDYVGGDVNSAANRDFVRKFIRDVVSQGDRGAMVDGDGMLSQTGKRRIEAALMAAAYDSPEIVADLFESSDNDIKSIGGALLDVSGLWAKMREEARTGQIPADMDTTQHLVDAVNIVRRARSEGKGVYDLANQNDMLSGQVHQSVHQFLEAFFRGERFTRGRSRDNVGSILTDYVSLARDTMPGDNMFGDPAPSSEQLLRRVNERQQATETPAEQSGLFAGTTDNAASNANEPGQAGQRGLEGVRGSTDESSQRSENVAPEKTSNNNKKSTAPKINDFGEKLEGARKDYANSYADDLNSVKDDDIASVPLSKSWPAPDYERLLNEGKDPLAVGFLRAVRDAVPTKPRTGYKVKSWARKVQSLRAMANTVLDMDAKAGREFINSAKTGQLADTVIFQAEMYAELGHEKSLAGLRLSKGRYGMYGGVEYDPPKVIWAVEGKLASSAFGSWPRQVASGDTREQAISNFKKVYPKLGDKKQEKKGISFSIYSRRGEPGYHIGKKVGGDYLDLKQFDDVKAARKYLAENHDELVKLLEKAKWVPDVRRSENAPRIGEDYRNGADVTPEMFQDAFGFRGVQFGNYVEGGRRQEDLNQAYDALMDLAGVLEIPSKAISLNGELGLAFGARGKGGSRAAAAHYEPGKVVINLTKKSGAGSLAHEWWHALDNYFARQDGRPNDFMTEALRSKGGVRPKMIAAFDAVARTVRGNAMFERSKNLDKRRTNNYWSTTEEMTARAFESYVINKLKDQGRANDYLANIVSEEGFALEGSYPYPTAGEIKGVRAAFDGFFRTVSTRETSTGIALESRSAARGWQDEKTLDLFNIGIEPSKQKEVPIMPKTNSKANAVVVDKTSDGTFSTVVESKTRGEISIGVENIITPEDAAHALASLRKYPQENVVALVTDKEGRPINVLRHTIGDIASASFIPKLIAGHAVRTPNAANVWIVHNHPSGASDLSNADLVAIRGLNSILRGSKIKTKGILAIAGNKFAFSGPLDSAASITNEPIPARARSRKIPIVERVFTRTGRIIDMPISSPQAAMEIVTRVANGRSGIVFANNQHEPTAFLPMTMEQMEKLKDTGELDRVLAGIEKSNAAAAFINLPLFVPRTLDAARNLGTMLHLSGTRVLDIIHPSGGEASRGSELYNRSLLFESRGKRPKLNSFSREIKDVIDEVTKNLPGAASLKVDVVNNIHQIPQQYRPSVYAEGVYVPFDGAGVIYLVADNLPSLERARQVLAHEIVGHYGMEALLGDKFSDVLADIERLTAIPDGVKLGIQRPGDKYYATLEAVKMDYPDYSTENQAREVLARMAETDVRPYFLERVYGYIRKFLRSIGLADRYSFAEIKNMVVEAADRLRTGTPEQSRAGVLSAAESLANRESRPFNGKETATTPVKESAKTIDVDGKKRPVMNSEGRPIHWSEEGVRNFWRWFKDSKIVDDQGRPRVVFHGTNAEFTEFSRSMVGKNTGWDNSRLGFFFIGDKPLAQDFLAKTSGGSNIIDAYLSIQNPIRLNEIFDNEAQASTLYEIFTGDKLDSESALDWINDEIDLGSYGDVAEAVSSDEALEILRRDGFDGAVSDFGSGNEEYIAFDPNQIKSASNNSGAFDWRSRDIFEQRTNPFSGSEKAKTPIGKAKEVEVDGVTRPALNSDGKPIHPTVEGVRNFWRWFGDSKTVDPDGKPMVVYHGTGADVEQFNRVAWGSADSELAGQYAQMRGEWYGGQANVMPAYMAISRPFDADKLDTPTSFEYPDGLSVKRFIDQIIEQSGVSGAGRSQLRALESGIRAAAKREESGPSYSPQDFWYRTEMTFGQDGASQIRRAFEIAGFDGVGLTEQGALTYGAFSPTQIKSATGNQGAFDPSSPNIMESRTATMGGIPTGAEQPRRRNPVERPGENLGEVERKLRERALGKIGAFAEVKPMRERAQELTNNMPKKLQQGIFDQFAPLKNLNITAYMQARLSKGTDGAAESLLRFGKVSLKDGAYEVDNSGGLAKVLSQLKGEQNYFFAWIAGNRAERLMAEGRENLFTPEEIQQLKRLNRGDKNFKNRAEVYEKALKEFNELQKSVMDVAEEAGLINPETRNLWEHEFYVPFYRVMEEDQTGTLGPGQINGLVGQRAFKRLTGGQEKLGDLLENTLSNWSHLLSASMKNLAAQKALKSAEEIGVADRISSAEKGSVRVMVDGKEQHYLVDDPFVLDALTALSYMGPTGPVMKAMQKAKRYLTTGVTISPTFRVRNLLRDTISAIAVNDISYNPIRNGMAGWKGTDSESPTYRKLVAGGGAIRFGAFNDGDQSANIQRLIDRGVDPDQILDSQAKVKRMFRGFFDWYQETGDRAETINRAAVYEQAIKDGKNHLEASYLARDLMDFSLGGSFASIRFLTQVVPFFNARLQGMYKLGRAAKNDPRRFAAVTGAVAMASALFYFMGKDDEEYEQLPDWVRNTYWVVRIPSTGKFVYIPKPFEVGALGTVVERMTELMFSGDDYKAKDFANTMMHVISDQLAMNPVPQLFKPAMGAFFNYDDFRGVNIDSMGQMRLPAEDRYRASTSAGAVALGQALNMSPQRIEFLVRGYFGWLGSQALNVADLAARPLTDMPSNPRRDTARIDNMFVIGDFVKESDSTSSKYIQRFYDSYRETEQLYAAFSQARKIGDIERAKELAQDEKLQLRPLYQSANSQLRKINQLIKQVDNNRTLSDDEKAQARELLYQERNRIAAMVDDRARALQ